MENIDEQEEVSEATEEINRRKELIEKIRRQGRPRIADHLLSEPRRKRRIPDNQVEWDASNKKIPERIERLLDLVITSRVRPHAAVLTLEDMDKMPDLRELPSTEKKLLIKYWPHYWESVEKIKAIGKLRAEEGNLVANAHFTANAIKEKYDFDSLSLAEQLKQTAHIYDRQIQHAALVLASTSIEQLHSDPLSLNLYRLRVNYIKDFAWVRDKIHDLGVRLEKDIVGFVEDAKVHDEGRRLLDSANETLRRKGVGLQ